MGVGGMGCCTARCDWKGTTNGPLTCEKKAGTVSSPCISIQLCRTTQSDAPAVDLETGGAPGEARALDELSGLDGVNPEGLSSGEADAELSVGDEKENGKEGLSKSWGWKGTCAFLSRKRAFGSTKTGKEGSLKSRSIEKPEAPPSWVLLRSM